MACRLGMFHQFLMKLCDMPNLAKSGNIQQLNILRIKNASKLALNSTNFQLYFLIISGDRLQNKLKYDKIVEKDD